MSYLFNKRAANNP